MTDFLDRCRDELVRAAERRSPTAVTSSAVRPRKRRLVGGFLIAAAIAAPAGATTAGWNPFADTGRETAAPSASNRAPAADLRDMLGVLRRAQTDADRSRASEAALRQLDRDVAGVQLAAVRVVRLPIGAVAIPVERAPGASAQSDAVCLYVPQPDGTASSTCQTAPAIRAGFAIGSAGPAVYGLVPDGVAVVRLKHGDQVADIPVEDNFFYRASGAPTAPTTAIWISASGGTVKTIDYTARSPARPVMPQPSETGQPCDAQDPHCVYVDAHGNLRVGSAATREEIERARRRAANRPATRP
jgi:hypothetical protein